MEVPAKERVRLGSPLERTRAENRLEQSGSLKPSGKQNAVRLCRGCGGLSCQPHVHTLTHVLTHSGVLFGQPQSILSTEWRG